VKINTVLPKPRTEEEVDEAFYRQLKVALQPQALVLVGDFHHPDNCWKTTQPGTCSPGGFCKASMITFGCKWWRNKQGEALCWTLY